MFRWIYFWILCTCCSGPNLSTVHVSICINLCFLSESSCSCFCRRLSCNSHAIMDHCLFMEEAIISKVWRSIVNSPWTCNIFLGHIVQICFRWIRPLWIRFTKSPDILDLWLWTTIASCIQVCAYGRSTIIIIECLLKHSLKARRSWYLSSIIWLFRALIIWSLYLKVSQSVWFLLFLLKHKVLVPLHIGWPACSLVHS